MSKDYSANAREIIAKNIYCVVATADSKTSKPWASPVFFAFDSDYIIYWCSAKDSLHSRNIRNNFTVGIVVFNSQAAEGDGSGVYFESEAYELTEGEEIQKAIDICNKRSTNIEFILGDYPNDCAGESPRRMYKAISKKVYTLTQGKTINGQYVDERIEIKL